MLLGLAASLALLGLNEGWLPWRDPCALTVAHTLALAPPLGAALLVRGAGDAYAWLCALAVALVWGALAWHESAMVFAACRKPYGTSTSAAIRSARNGSRALAFHARDDVAEVRREVFRVLMQHDLRFYAAVRSESALLDYVKQRGAARGVRITGRLERR